MPKGHYDRSLTKEQRAAMKSKTAKGEKVVKATPVAAKKGKLVEVSSPMACSERGIAKAASIYERRQGVQDMVVILNSACESAKTSSSKILTALINGAAERLLQELDNIIPLVEKPLKEQLNEAKKHAEKVAATEDTKKAAELAVPAPMPAPTDFVPVMPQPAPSNGA